MKHKALLVANNGPEMSFGGGQRNLLAIRILEKAGYDVDLVVLLNKDWGSYEPDHPVIQNWTNQFRLIKLFRPDFKKPFVQDSDVSAYLKGIQKEYSLILFRDENTAFKAGFYRLDRKKIILDLNDFIYPHVHGWRKTKYWPLLLVTKLSIKKAWVLIESQKRFIGNKAVCVPNLAPESFNPVHRDTFLKSRTAQPSLIFVGSYLEELISFLTEAEDLLLESIPELKIFIVSRAASAELKNKFNKSNYEWLDNVGDVAEIYQKAWVSIIPGYKKDGPLIKVIESVYFNTPVVCTNVSINGYERFNADEQLIPCSDNVSGFVDNIKILLSDEKGLDIRVKKMKEIADVHFSLNYIMGIPGLLN